MRIGVLAFLLLPVATSQTPPPDPRFDLQEGFVWSSPDGNELKADLYLPKSAGPFPVVLYLHGGGWSSGDRKQLRRQAADLAASGIAGFAIEYRLAPAHRFPAAFHDAQAAVEWVNANAAKYRLDAKRLVAAGSSAGGHLACLLGVSGADILGVVAFNPVLDLSDKTQRDGNIVKFLGGKCDEVPDLCREASPVSRVTSRAKPFLILHGTGDETVPYHQATDMVAKLKAAGVPVQLFTAEGAPHTFWSNPRWYEPSLDAMRTFLAERFR